jgi:hypothetical protein
MAEEEAEQQPSMNHIEMTHICNACDEDCETACKNDTCKLIRKA